MANNESFTKPTKPLNLCLKFVCFSLPLFVGDEVSTVTVHEAATLVVGRVRY